MSSNAGLQLSRHALRVGFLLTKTNLGICADLITEGVKEVSSNAGLQQSRHALRVGFLLTKTNLGICADLMKG